MAKGHATVSSHGGTVAYFSMEIGLQADLPTYSGGLGVLAGDTIRAAADMGVPMVAVTLLYHKGYFRQDLDEDGQVAFKGKAKAFVRTYNFLASILPYSNASWEKLSVFLNFLIPKLPAPREDDLSRGILETIDMESYRVEVESTLDISLEDRDGEIGPVPTSEVGLRPEAAVDYLSNIIQEFNDMFPDADWKDADKVAREIAEEIPAKVAADRAYQNAIRHSDRQNARIEHDRALDRVMIELMADFTELFKQYSDNPAFKRWLSDRNFQQTYSEANG